MNLPDWATHVAVDKSGYAAVFEGPPRFMYGTVWDQGATGQRWRYADVARVAHLLCVAVPRTEREENEP